MSQPSVGAYASVFEAIRRYRPHQDSLYNVLKNFVDGIEDAEASVLPKSIVDIMPLLKPDIHRLRFAADILARLDLYESTGSLLAMAIETRDRQLMMAAASLAGNPAVDSSLRDRIKTYSSDDRMVTIRLSPDVVPSSEHEKMLYLQCWPGGRTADMPLQFAPVVVLDVSLPPASSLKLSTILEGAGAVVRRLDTSAPLPHWFGYQTALVCKPENADIVRSKYPRFASNQIFTDALPSRSDKLIQRIAKILSSIPRVKQNEYELVSLTDVVHVGDELQTGLRDQIDEYCTVVSDLGALAYNIPSDLHISCRGYRLRAIVETDTTEIDTLTQIHISAIASIFGAFNDTAGVLLLTCPPAFSGVVIERADLEAAIEVPHGDYISARIRRPVSDAVTACRDFVRELAPTFEPLDFDRMQSSSREVESPDIEALVNSSITDIINQGARARTPEKRAAWTDLRGTEKMALVDMISELKSGNKSPNELHSWLDSVVTLGAL